MKNAKIVKYKFHICKYHKYRKTNYVVSEKSNDFSYIKFYIIGGIKMKAYVCKVCGYVHIGDEAPEKCPQVELAKTNLN